MDSFIKPRLKRNNLDVFLIRTAIFKSIELNLSLFSGNMLDIGCGKMPYKEFIISNSSVKNYVGLDIDNALIYDELVKPDIFWDGIKMPLENESFETAIATEVLEHCPKPSDLLKEAHRVLKKGGILFFTVPFLWNLHEVPNDEYRYTPYSLERHLKEAGFSEINLKPMGGWHASFAQMMGLWVRRAPLRNWQRNSLSIIFKPIIRYLIKKDKKIPFTFNERQMITGISGFAQKT